MTDTTEVRVHPCGVRTIDLGYGLVLTQAMARQLDRIECYDAPLSGGCIQPIGRVRTGIKVNVQRKLPGHPGTVTARHTFEACGWQGSGEGDWYEDIDIDPHLEVIGHAADDGTLIIWVLDSRAEYFKYHDDPDERTAIDRAADTLP